MTERIADKALQLPPITLEEMSGIKLMNRTDTKFVATLRQLNSFLIAVQGKYYIQEINGKRIARNVYDDTVEECEIKFEELIKEMKAEFGIR